MNIQTTMKLAKHLVTISGILSLSISWQSPSFSRTPVMSSLGDSSSLEALQCLDITDDTWSNLCQGIIHIGYVDKNSKPSSMRLNNSTSIPEKAVAIGAVCHSVVPIFTKPGNYFRCP